MTYPVPPSHRTFIFDGITIDSNFESGNCCNAARVSRTCYNLWIGADNPKNNYRTWFYFSADGFRSGSKVTFRIQNMQNQSRLLNEGLVPVFRESSGQVWARIAHKVDTNGIEFNEGRIQWEFSHTWLSDDKVFFAFFYPWSNQDNNHFLTKIQQKAKGTGDIYFYRNPIIHSLEKRPIELLVISSNKARKAKRQQTMEDQHLFVDVARPSLFTDRKFVVIGARVHPGEVPGSHVVTGLIEQLTENSAVSQLLRQNFVFYIFPILNPDGVARGHYRVDTNGMNLNRCYVNPSPKHQPSIYAVKKIVSYLHQQKKFYAFLDLHAHATKRGCFAYGNFTNELMSQVDACLFPKILSINSADFQYKASNFTKSNMSCKEKADHVSKEGSGRVAIFKATKNACCWTLQCNYNMSRVHNVLETQKTVQEQPVNPSEEQLNSDAITQLRDPSQKQAREFYTMETYRKLGTEICQSFLDLIEKNPYSRIGNPHNHYRSVQNLRMNLAIALMRMEPSRFEPLFRKISLGLANQQNSQMFERSLRALYLTTILNVKINNIHAFIREENLRATNLPVPDKKSKSLPRPSDPKAKETSLLGTNIIKQAHKQSYSKELMRPTLFRDSSSQKEMKAANDESQRSSGSLESPNRHPHSNYTIYEGNVIDNLANKFTIPNKRVSCDKVSLRLDEYKLLGSAFNSPNKHDKSSKMINMKLRAQCLPSLSKFNKTSINTPLLTKGLSLRSSKMIVN